jgi:chaperone modulatory protein CbpM
MEPRQAEAVWLTEDNEFSFSELVALSGFSEAELRELVDYGVVVPVDPDSPRWVFKGRALTTVRVACRLRESFELEPHGVALIISFLERIQGLEDELRSLRARMPRPSPTRRDP